MIVLLDTDVLIDLALARDNGAVAGELLDALETRPGSGFVAWHSISNFYYLVAPTQGRVSTRQFVLDLTTFVEIAPTTTEHVRQAARFSMKDFEDAMQVGAAIACGADVIATRNTRDYTRSPVRAETPTRVLRSLLS